MFNYIKTYNTYQQVQPWQLKNNNNTTKEKIIIFNQDKL